MSESLLKVRQIIDPESLCEAFRHAQFDVRQLARSEKSSVLERLYLPNTCLDHVFLRPALHSYGVTAQDAYTLVIVTKCKHPGHSFNFSMTHKSGYLAMFPPGAEADSFSPQDYKATALTMPRDLFETAIRKIYPEIAEKILTQGVAVKVADEELARLNHMLGSVALLTQHGESFLSVSSAACFMESDLTAAFIEALRSGIEKSTYNVVQRHPRRMALFRKAMDMINDSLVSIKPADLCLQLGCSRRTLEYMFQDLLGKSPASYIRIAKLHRARRFLLNQPHELSVVKRVALESGFWHLGHFAENYRMLFGELPSITASPSHSLVVGG